jgi:hypothetical protein
MKKRWKFTMFNGKSTISMGIMGHGTKFANCNKLPEGNHLEKYEFVNGFRMTSHTHDGSMVLLYMVCHGSHQYTTFMLAYIPAPWILWDILWKIKICETTSQMALYHVFEFHRIAAYSMKWSNPMFPAKKQAPTMLEAQFHK